VLADAAAATLLAPAALTAACSQIWLPPHSLHCLR
jgi:hypothetical protein